MSLVHIWVKMGDLNTNKKNCKSSKKFFNVDPENFSERDWTRCLVKHSILAHRPRAERYSESFS